MRKGSVLVMLAVLIVFPVIAVTEGIAEDWDAIYEAAKGEGKVVIYSLSSRIFDAVESFQEKYPGIEVEASDMLTVDQIEKLTREQAAGVYNVDVLHLADVTTLTKEVLPQGLIENYVPETLLGGQRSEDVIPEYLREPLLAQSLESKVVFYNFESYPEAPVDTLWDLTRPEWKGRVQMKDPLQSVENMNFLQTIVQHADDMAKIYEEEFGEPITLRSGVENAGYEYILRLVENDLVLTTSDGDASKAVGAAGQTDPPLTFSVASSKLRNNKKGLKLAIAWDLKPVVGFTKRNFLVLANKAPHPNAAKLLIQWLLGDEQGGAGMEPFFVPGGWPSRSDVKPPIETTLDGLKEFTWFLDPEFIYERGLDVRDFWLGL
ncbi:iron ABC transporter substrate-binding protein [candidate division KSB3 bacterium]|uniref:Iron ABC transporter substrate-binding protein n=1 Tax=candidate division KSB3 bacterium TaxID=2044937 RepID=A0A2G6KF49_9BACT|nr:MAG: iron ABC transporter substrate-binding protein [candidate division KSB3 bacterium]